MAALLRNPRFLRECGFLAATAAVFTLAAWFASGAASGLWALAMGVALIALFAAFSALRFREIEHLTGEIDAVLHQARPLEFSAYREGDVAVLRNELAKMVARLSRTTDLLASEKQRLADALADISHQIRTPLTAMNLLIPSIERADDHTRRKTLLRELEQLVERISWLVTTLLKTARADSGTLVMEKQQVNAAELFREACAPLAPALDLHDIALVETFPKGSGAPVSFMGDARWTAEALENIVKNAMEHTPDGGTITLSATEDALATRLTIADTGPGLSPEELPHIFDRFYTRPQRPPKNSEDNTAESSATCFGEGSTGNPAGDSSRCFEESSAKDSAEGAPAGFGIGLSLAQALLSAQGATLHASNGELGGARFEITFPKVTV